MSYNEPSGTTTPRRIRLPRLETVGMGECAVRLPGPDVKQNPAFYYKMRGL